jgi:hypothetical protein
VVDCIAAFSGESDIVIPSRTLTRLLADAEGIAAGMSRSLVLE